MSPTRRASTAAAHQDRGRVRPAGRAGQQRGHRPRRRPGEQPSTWTRCAAPTRPTSSASSPSPRRCCRCCKKSEAGRIVNLSSGLGSLTQNSDPNWGFAGVKPLAYNSSKAALNMITVILAAELKDTPHQSQRRRPRLHRHRPEPAQRPPHRGAGRDRRRPPGHPARRRADGRLLRRRRRRAVVGAWVLLDIPRTRCILHTEGSALFGAFGHKCRCCCVFQLMRSVRAHRHYSSVSRRGVNHHGTRHTAGGRATDDASTASGPRPPRPPPTPMRAMRRRLRSTISSRSTRASWPSTTSAWTFTRARSSASSAPTAREDDHHQDPARPDLPQRRRGPRPRQTRRGHRRQAEDLLPPRKPLLLRAHVGPRSRRLLRLPVRPGRRGQGQARRLPAGPGRPAGGRAASRCARSPRACSSASASRRR